MTNLSYENDETFYIRDFNHVQAI